MKIYFTSDHAGFEMKNLLIEFVKELGLEVIDLGPNEFDKELANPKPKLCSTLPMS